MDLENNAVHERILCSVMAIAETEAKEDLHMSISLPVLKAMGDMVVHYMEVLARDLEMFAQHAGRKSVKVDDVLLSARRNPDVAAKLMPVVQELEKVSKKNKDESKRKKESKEKGKSKKRDAQGDDEPEEAARSSPPRGEGHRHISGEASSMWKEKRQKS